jgi:enterochelin esterase-like enzyme
MPTMFRPRLVMLSALLGATRASAQGQQGPQNISTALQRIAAAAPQSRQRSVDSLWQLLRRTGTPAITPLANRTDSVDATFLTRTPVQPGDTVYFVGGPTRIDSSVPALGQLAATDLWFHTYRLPATARFLYVFATQPAGHPDSVRVVLDSLNPRTGTFPTGTLIQSVFEGPRAPSLQASVARTGIARGTLVARTFRSRLLDQTRNIQVYLPPGFDPSLGADTPLVVLFDALPYTDSAWVPTPTIVDNLIADRRIAAPVVVLIDNPQSTRRVDLWLSETFADFVATELIPWARDTFHLGHDANRTVIGGSSLGGLTAMFVAMRHPDMVAKVISQSGSYWTARREGADSAPEWLRRTLAAMPRLPLSVWMEVGSYEGPADATPTGQVPANRRMRDLLKEQGYPLFYQEFAGAHEYINWRASLPAALEYFLGSPPH